MRSLNMSETSSASAYLRRYTLTFVSSVVFTSRASMIFLNNCMFSAFVIRMILLDFGSAIAVTRPLMMPCDASEALTTRAAAGVSAGAGWPERRGTPRSERVTEDGRGAELFGLFKPPFFCRSSCSFSESATIFSMIGTMSLALAFTIWMHSTSGSGSAGCSTSISSTISSMRLMFR